MTNQPRSCRVNEAQERFMERTEFNFSRFVQDALTDERIKQAIGVCAVCGDILYSGSGGEYNTSERWASYSSGSPGGTRLGLDERHEHADLCEEHDTAFMDVFTREINDENIDSTDYPELDYVNEVYFGNISAYMMETRAVKHARPGTKYGTLLVTERSNHVLPDDKQLYRKRLDEALRVWLTDEDTPRNFQGLDFYDVYDDATAFSVTEELHTD